MTCPAWGCPNCQFSASGEFCSNCGQSRQEWNISTVAWLRRAMSDVFDLDGRFVRTIRLLIAHPGELTEAWIDGRRASFVSPLRLYLLISAILFGVLALPGLSAAGSSGVEGALDSVIDNWTESADAVWYRSLQEVADDEAALTLMAANITENLPRAMFLLFPVGALLLKVLIRRPKQNYVVHLVWTLHAHSVLFLISAVFALLDPLRGTAKYAVAYPIGAAGMLWGTWYFVKAFSRVYTRSFAKSAAIVTLAVFMYFPVFVLTVVLLSRAAL